MANLSKVVKVTQAQYDTLIGGGTVGGESFDANAIYLIGTGDFLTTVLESIYPVGSIYINYTGVKPDWMANLGTWEQIKDRFLLMAGDTYSGGATGGAATVTLTTAQMPYHNHSQILTNTNNYSVGIGTGFSGNYYRMNSSVSTNTINQELHTGYNGGSNGETQAHNNMPPYLVVYGWRRTA